MSLGSLDDFSANYGALAMAETEENNVIKWGLPSEVLETMTDYSSPSVDGLRDDIDLWEFYGEDKEESPNPAPPQAYGMYPSYLKHEVNDQRYLQEQERNQVLEDQLVASEVTNWELTNTISSISTAHVMVCLECDNLKRLKKVSSCIICILLSILLVVLFYMFG